MSRTVARAVVALLLVPATLGVGYYVWSGLDRQPLPGVPEVIGLDIAFTLAFTSFLPLGAFIALRRPRNPIGWIMCVSGFSVAASAATAEYAIRAVLIDPALPGGREMAWVSSWVGVPGVGMLTFLMLLFPTGTVAGPRWRWVARVAAVDLLVLFLGFVALWPERGVDLVISEAAPSSALVPAVVFEASWVLMMVGALAGLVSLVVRFRRAEGVEKQQLKWMAYVAAALVVLLLVNLFLFELLGVGYNDFRIFSEYLFNLAVVGIPVATAIAILRYRLYDIDRIINRTLVYGALTAILAATYLALVFSLQNLFTRFTSESDLVIAASTLAVAFLFRPLRSRLQDFIDRRFYRRRFDARTTLETFSSELRQEVDLESLSARLTNVVSDTMQPTHVSIWLRRDVET